MDNTTDVEAFYRCYPYLLSSSQQNISKYLLYSCSAWIIFWCLLTVLINALHKNVGNQRFIHFFEELAICALSVFIFVLNFLFIKNERMCEIVSLGSQYLMVLTAGIFLMEAFFASWMVHGRSNKDGCPLWIAYYILPILIAAIPTAATYFTEKDYYGTSAIHCFAVSTIDMLWGFVIPVWLLVALTGLKAQLACIACNKNHEDQDQEQCFWARRSVKSLLMTSLFIFSTWLMTLFAYEHQVLYLFIIVTAMCFVLGPTLFVVHTFCHLNTCQKWGGGGIFGSLYAMCPPKVIDSSDKEIETEKPESKAGPHDGPKIEEAALSDPPPKSFAHTQSQRFYDWLTDHTGKLDSHTVLFQSPKVF
ncbi:unnamed protein product [Caenorhabditis auriculariae]|uniref:Uncharacterized protein n=1 Tax=Caenorhabditis auriculariae TaxID=2777116 RepID=A0A8S1H347_9PELO|nr:unnamed protein product [Caenorhabditis auriculariae]